MIWNLFGRYWRVLLGNFGVKHRIETRRCYEWTLTSKPEFMSICYCGGQVKWTSSFSWGSPMLTLAFLCCMYIHGRNVEFKSVLRSSSPGLDLWCLGYWKCLKTGRGMLGKFVHKKHHGVLSVYCL